MEKTITPRLTVSRPRQPNYDFAPKYRNRMRSHHALFVAIPSAALIEDGGASQRVMGNVQLIRKMPRSRWSSAMVLVKVVGKLDKALDAAPAAGWTVVDMKNDWKTIFPFGSK
jgi:hypothetical protein